MPVKLTRLLLTGVSLPVVLAVILGIQGFCWAQDKTASPIDWQDGPTVGKLGDIAQISVPKGFRFTGKAGAQKLLELTQNPSDGDELGALIPVVDKNGDLWFSIFEFQDTGYVRDDEKDKLDSGAMLESIKKATEESNKIRAERGWAAFHVIGWSHTPYYDASTHNLIWALIGASDQSGKSQQAINYSIRLLGRRGIVKADLVLDPAQVTQVFPEFQGLLGGFSFMPGQRYAEWRSGDKVAKYGLTALVVGGAATAAIKSGLLLKFWKLIVAAFVALGAFLKRVYNYFKRMLRGKAAEGVPQQE
jgi:uncharacterized membrane-anchored protein